MTRMLTALALFSLTLVAQTPTPAAADTRPSMPKAGPVRIGIECDRAALMKDGVARISKVMADSPAAGAGLMAGDVITAVNGAKIDGDAAWRKAVAGKKEGDALSIEYTRGNAPAKAEVKLVASLPRKEPDVVKVQHCLIGFKGATRSTATRSREEAQKLADDIAARVKAGEDFGAIVKQLTDDPGSKTNDPPGSYEMTNNGVPEKKGASQRSGMVTGFGTLAFTLEVGEIAVVPYDAKLSPFGYHVMLRIQ